MEVNVLGSGCAKRKTLEAGTVAALGIDAKAVLVSRVRLVEDLRSLLAGIVS